MLIDSHHHLWKYSTDEYGWINDQMLPLRADFSTAGTARDCIPPVQSMDLYPFRQDRPSKRQMILLAMANADPLICGVVGWVPLSASDVSETLERSR